jgi:hypothetical protein
MPTNYPAAFDSFTNPSAGDSLASPSHAGQHANINDAMEAVQATLGTDPQGSEATVADRIAALEGGGGGGSGSAALASFDSTTGISGQFTATGTRLAVTGQVGADYGGASGQNSIKLRLRNSVGGTVSESDARYFMETAAAFDATFFATHTFTVTPGTVYDVQIVAAVLTGSAAIGGYSGTIVG